MPDNSLADWVNTQLAAGYGRDALANILYQHGYTKEQVEAALPPLPNPNPAKSKTKLVLALVVLVLLLAALGALYFLVKPSQSTNEETQNSSQPTTGSPEDCARYEDLGYINGLYASGSASPSAPSQCESAYEQGLIRGTESRAVQFAEANDAQRRTDLIEIGNAVYLYASENNGIIPPEITSVPKEIGTGEGKLDLSTALRNYFSIMPHDPVGGSEESTGYFISLTQEGRVLVEANSEVTPGTKLSVTR